MKTGVGDDFKSALKAIMKKQNRSYIELAEELDVSLVTVKRIMSKEEMSLTRLLQICEWLDVTLADLEKITHWQSTKKRIYFTVEQEKFLTQYPEYLGFLFRLYTEDSPEKIQNEFGLSAKSLNLYLLRLEKIELIKKVRGEYKPIHKQFPLSIPYGLLQSSQQDKVLKSAMLFFERFNRMRIQRKNAQLDKGSQSTLSVLDMSHDVYLKWYDKYLALQEELIQISKSESLVSKTEQKSVVLFHLHALVEQNDIELDSIKNMFGRLGEVK